MAFSSGQPVPAYAYVFHEYATNFMGNQVDVGQTVDLVRFPENIYYRLAYSFVTGDLLTVVLLDDGQLHWAWCSNWDVTPPNQQPLLRYILHLNSWRSGLAKDFLYFGRMERAAAFTGPEEQMFALNDGRSISYSAVLSSRWTSPDGATAQIFVNVSDEIQPIHLPDSTGTLYLRLEDPTHAISGVTTLNLAPHTAALLK